MILRIKFCGGCNPRFDRRSIVTKIEEEYKDIKIVYSDGDEIPDLLVVICGCTAQCAEYKSIKFKYKSVVIYSEDGYNKIKEAIEEIKK